MKSIYRNEKAKKSVLDLYDKQINELNIPYQDIYVDTSFGKTHLIECGNLNGKPLLVFHGGNSTTAYNLKYCNFLLPHFHICAVDTMGHPGKSA
ncbi:MAG: alpha/beta hydrolase, partial [Ruminococcus sp.]